MTTSLGGQRIGLIGVGNLGREFLLRSCKLGKQVIAYDKNTSQIPAAEKNLKVAASIADVSAETDIVVSIVPNDQALRLVAKELIQTKKKLLHISCSTVSPSLSRELAEEHKRMNQSYVAAPVFARPENLRAGQACFMLSGEYRHVQIARDALTDIADRVVDFGNDPGAANVVKLAGNFMIASSIEIMAEACALAEKNHVDREKTMDLLSSTIFDCAIFRGYGHRVSRRDHRPGGFALEHGLKDIKLVLDTAQAAAQPLPLASLLHHRLQSAANANRSQLDWSALALEATSDGGLHDQVHLALSRAGKVEIPDEKAKPS